MRLAAQAQAGEVIEDLQQQVMGATEAAHTASERATALDRELARLGKELAAERTKEAPVPTAIQEELHSARTQLLEAQESNTQLQRDMEAAAALQVVPSEGPCCENGDDASGMGHVLG